MALSWEGPFSFSLEQGVLPGGGCGNALSILFLVVCPRYTAHGCLLSTVYPECCLKGLRNSVGHGCMELLFRSGMFSGVHTHR